MQTHTHTHFHPMVHIHMLAPSPFIGSVFRGTSSQSGRLDIFRSNNLSQTLRVALVSPSALRTRWLVQGGLPVWPRRQTLYTNTQLRLKEFLLRYIFVHHTPWLLLLPHPVKKTNRYVWSSCEWASRDFPLFTSWFFFFLKSPEISPDALDDGWGGGSMRNGSDKGLRWMDVGEEEPAVSKKQRGGGGLCHEGAVCVCVCDGNRHADTLWDYRCDFGGLKGG